MIMKLLGFGDVVAALTAILMAILPFALPKTIVFYIAGYLIFKGIIFAFSGNLVSYLDLFFGIYLMLMTYGISSKFITIFMVVFLFQKNILSLVR